MTGNDQPHRAHPPRLVRPLPRRPAARLPRFGFFFLLDVEAAGEGRESPATEWRVTFSMSLLALWLPSGKSGCSGVRFG